MGPVDSEFVGGSACLALGNEPVNPPGPCCPQSGEVLIAADCGLLGVRGSVRLSLPSGALAQVSSQWPAHTAQSVPRTHPGTRTCRKDSNSDCLPHITCLPHHRVPWPFLSPPHSPALALGSLSSLFSPTLLCHTAPSGIGDASPKRAYFTREVGALPAFTGGIPWRTKPGPVRQTANTGNI